MEKQLNEIDGEMKTTGWVWRVGDGGRIRWRVFGSDCLSIPVCVPPGGTNVSFEQFVDSPLSSWPVPIQTGSIFWTLGMPRASRGHQCVIQMPWLHSHHLLPRSWISGLVFFLHFSLISAGGGVPYCPGFQVNGIVLFFSP